MSESYGYVLETGEVAIEADSAALANDARVAATYLGEVASTASEA